MQAFLKYSISYFTPKIAFYLHTYTGRTLCKRLTLNYLRCFVYMMHVFFKKIFFSIYNIL